MDICNINRKSQKYQTLKNMSGISDFSLSSQMAMFNNQFGRDPELDELQGVNSEPHLRKFLNIKEFSNLNVVDTNNLLNLTNSSSVEEANIKLNNQYRDLEIKLNQFSTFVSVEIKHRFDNKINLEYEGENNYSPEKSRIILCKQFDKLKKLFGINIIPEESDSLVKGYIKNGEIHINLNASTIDTPLHELMHIFLGSVRYTNPTLYFSLVNQVESLENYQNESLKFQGRTRGDVNEEIFVQEFSKYLTQQPSMFDSINTSKLMYEIYRNIDSLIEGKYSIKTIDHDIFGDTILNLAYKLKSSTINNNQVGTLTAATIHRMLANFKEDLINKNLLEEKCNG